MNSNFSENLKKIRKDNDLSQEMLADKLGVSRQSVSKWESGMAYPEMDKVIQICKMFDLNLDELLNQDMEIVNESREAKKKSKEYYNEFISFITTSVKMFYQMTFKSKMKCLIEQFINVLIFIIIYSIIDELGFNLIYKVFSNISEKAVSISYSIINLLFTLFYIIFSGIVITRIFKLRYLNYYEKAKNEEKVNIEDNKIPERKEKVIEIRDEYHTESRLVNRLFDILMFFIKSFTFILLVTVSLLLIFCVSLLVVDIVHIYLHKIFLCLLVSLIGCIILSYVFVKGLFAFTFNKKISLKRLFILFSISLFTMGIGFGLTFVSSLKINYIDESNMINETKEVPFKNDIIIESNHDTYEFIIDNSLTETILIDITRNDYVTYEPRYSNNYLYFNYESKYNDISSVYKAFKEDIKSNQIRSYDNTYPSIIYKTSEENIKKIIYNMSLNNITELNVNNNSYVLTIQSYDEDKILCENNNGYYNDCYNIEGNINLDDFSLEDSHLKYDISKYTCSNYDKTYECYLSE